MKKFFQLTGFITIMCLSFFYTEKAVEVVKEYDIEYKKILEIENKYYKEPINASINENTIIPGISGIKVNRDLSYSKMKRYGEFNEYLLVLDYIKPEISIENNKDKYVISGNKNKNNVSIILIINKDVDINYILNILDEKKINLDFFVDGMWAEENTNKLEYIKSKNHNIGNLSYNMDYTNSSFIWLDSIIKKVTKNKIGYCYCETEDENTIKTCSKNNNYTIRPSIILKNNLLNNIKEKLEKGSIISIYLTKNNINEVLAIINYIQSKGYAITTLNELVGE